MADKVADNCRFPTKKILAAQNFKFAFKFSLNGDFWLRIFHFWMKIFQLEKNLWTIFPQQKI